jgi:SAM-dependent methyltransferase
VNASQFLNWNVAEDAAHVVDSAVALRKSNAELVYAPIFSSERGTRQYLASDRVVWRRRTLEKFALFTGRPIAGKVIEIGAGTGWCSAVLSQEPAVEEVYALEYDAYCVETLIPMVHRALGAKDAKVRRVLGSFNLLKCADGFFDLVVSIGALHHSENLRATLRECHRALKSGGWLLATEPCEFNSMTQREHYEIMHRPIPSDDGRTVTKAEKSDHIVRLCQYEAAAFDAGFDVTSFVFDATSASGGSAAAIGRMCRGLLRRDALFTGARSYTGFHRHVTYPYFAKKAFPPGAALYDKGLFFLRKP